MTFVEEVKEHLVRDLIPFWEGLEDTEYGGYYGYLGFDLVLDRKAVKGCILNSRILWFFSNAYMLLADETLLQKAEHAYRFLRDYAIDRTYGGVYWSLTYDGRPDDTTKHTYNQAFAIYALSSYYNASGDKEALQLALSLSGVIEEKCTDEFGYLEAFNERFEPEDNDKLSENGVMAEKTMNTLLHVFEGYTELLRVLRRAGAAAPSCAGGSTTDSGLNTGQIAAAAERIAGRLRFMFDLFESKVYNRELGRQEVFFDREWNTLIDLYSFGHDIETSWLMDRGLEILDDPAYTARITPITTQIADNIYQRAYMDHSLVNEAENGVVDTRRIWWVQAETVLGFLNRWQKEPARTEYLTAAEDVWGYIKQYMIDPRKGSEWFSEVDAQHRPIGKPIVEPWKCPYHNGRMCMEVIKRLS